MRSKNLGEELGVRSEELEAKDLGEGLGVRS